jgi:hypothetical protein
LQEPECRNVALTLEQLDIGAPCEEPTAIFGDRVARQCLMSLERYSIRVRDGLNKDICGCRRTLRVCVGRSDGRAYHDQQQHSGKADRFQAMVPLTNTNIHELDFWLGLDHEFGPAAEGSGDAPQEVERMAPRIRPQAQGEQIV